MEGRPIAVSHLYITRPISIFIDKLTKPKIRMPAVLRDSDELIQFLENTILPNTGCRIPVSKHGYEERTNCSQPASPGSKLGSHDSIVDPARQASS